MSLRTWTYGQMAVLALAGLVGLYLWINVPRGDIICAMLLLAVSGGISWVNLRYVSAGRRAHERTIAVLQTVLALVLFVSIVGSPR